MKILSGLKFRPTENYQFEQNCTEVPKCDVIKFSFCILVFPLPYFSRT